MFLSISLFDVNFSQAFLIFFSPNFGSSLTQIFLNLSTCFKANVISMHFLSLPPRVQLETFLAFNQYGCLSVVTHKFFMFIVKMLIFAL
jgi:hypothetical protein